MALPVGLQGFLAMRQAQQAEQDSGLKGLLGIAQMGHLVAQTEMEKQKMSNSEKLQQIISGYFGSGAPQSATAGMQPSGTSQSTPAQTSSPEQVLNMIARISALDPQRGRAILETWKAQNPEVKWEGGIPVNPRSGQPLINAPIIPQTNQAGFSTTKFVNPITGQVEVALTPGGSEAYRTQQRIGEEERARLDVMTVPPTGPGTPPTFATRLDVARPQQGPVTQPQVVDPRLLASKAYQAAPPEQKAAMEQVLAASDMGLSAAVTTPRVSPRAAGMTPLQKADVAGTEKFKETLGSQAGQLAGGLTDAAQKAESQLANINAIRVAVDEIKKAGGATGAYQPMIQRATELVQGLGIDPAALGLPADAGPFQMLNALTNKMALGLIGVPGGMPANLFSEADRAFVQASVVRPVDTESGVNAKLDMFEKMNRRAVDAEQSWLKAQEEGKSFGQWRMEWSKYVRDEPLFKADDRRKMMEANKPVTSSRSLTPAEQTELQHLRKKYRR
jgi:hypothetical protein